MELIINSKEYDVFSKEVPTEVVGYNFYSLTGNLYGRYPVKNSGYPRSNYKIIVHLNGNEFELNNNENLYKDKNGKYFIGREIE